MKLKRNWFFFRIQSNHRLIVPLIFLLIEIELIKSWDFQRMLTAFYVTTNIMSLQPIVSEFQSIVSIDWVYRQFSGSKQLKYFMLFSITPLISSVSYFISYIRDVFINSDKSAIISRKIVQSATISLTYFMSKDCPGFLTITFRLSWDLRFYLPWKSRRTIRSKGCAIAVQFGGNRLISVRHGSSYWKVSSV